MNKVQLSGRPTRDPIIRSFVKKDKNGNDVDRKVASFNLAVDIIAGRKQEQALFVQCSGFGKTEEIIENRVKQGNKIIVEGYLHPNNYKKGDVSVYSIDVIVENVEFCSSKQSQGDEINSQQNDGDGFMDIPDDLELGLPLPV